MLPTIHIGYVQINSFGLMVVLGLNVGLVAMYIYTRRSDVILSQQLFRFWTIMTLVYGIAGQIGNNVLYEQSDIWNTNGGSTILGGLTGCILILPIIARILKQGWRFLSDVFVVGFVPTYIFGKIGCFLGGCCYGRPSNLPWCLIPSEESTSFPKGQQLHPAQLYEIMSLFAFLPFIVYWWHPRRCKVTDGFLTGAFLLFYGAERFCVEYVRGDIVPGFWHMTVGQIGALGLVIIGVVIFLLCHNLHPRMKEMSSMIDCSRRNQASQSP